MKRLHPNRHDVAVAVLWVAIGLSGCRGQQTAMTNPFLSPDRVPPPATRTVAPGTAQPYYPGEPLPSMQSAAPATLPASVAGSSDVAAANTLAWSSEPAPSVPTDSGNCGSHCHPLRQSPTRRQSQRCFQPTVRAEPPIRPLHRQLTTRLLPIRYRHSRARPALPIMVLGDHHKSQRHLRCQIRRRWSPRRQSPLCRNRRWRPRRPHCRWCRRRSRRCRSNCVPLDMAASSPPRIRFADPGMPSQQPGGVVQTVQATELPPASAYYPNGVPYMATQPQTGLSTSPDGFRPRGSAW
jgi:hypothetical protein